MNENQLGQDNEINFYLLRWVSSKQILDNCWNQDNCSVLPFSRRYHIKENSHQYSNFQLIRLIRCISLTDENTLSSEHNAHSMFYILLAKTAISTFIQKV